MSTSSSHSQPCFRYNIRVPYAHVDQMGFVYYANYFVYFEMARSELLREAGIPYTKMEKQGVFLPVVEAHCVYRKPAHYDDLLSIESRCSIRGIRLRIDYTLQSQNELLAEGHTEHVCMNRKGKALRPVQEIKRLVHPPVV
ncbi:MAG: acyl-CoA thioesterase [Candidatus Aureabacteria bacterium]|nr:acyl-CoA thioesterase [Candidatus Auribacterota bacterium]